MYSDGWMAGTPLEYKNMDFSVTAEFLWDHIR